MSQDAASLLSIKQLKNWVGTNFFNHLKNALPDRLRFMLLRIDAKRKAGRCRTCRKRPVNHSEFNRAVVVNEVQQHLYVAELPHGSVKRLLPNASPIIAQKADSHLCQRSARAGKSASSFTPRG